MQTLLKRLATVVGTQSISTDPADCDLATADIFEWPGRRPALAVVRPADTAEVAALVTLAREAGLAIVARGAGLSYTGGLAVERDAIVVETNRLDTITVDRVNMVATIGAGASWQSVLDRLAPHGLRSAQPSPISGAHSTVGGLASQGLPAGTQGVLALTVVLPDGSIVRTGPKGQTRAGPDITGMFLGDCGALGLKTELTIRLERRPAAAFATFQFSEVADLVACLSSCMAEGVATRAFAMDGAKTDQARAVDAGDAVSASLAVMRNSGTALGAVKNAAKLVGFAMSRPASQRSWTLHLTVESPTEEGARAQLKRIREICGDATEAPDIFPRTLHAKPYSVRGFVGPDGERWAPVHGIFAPARATAAIAALQVYVDSRREQMAAHGITTSWLLSSSASYILVEPMLYWPDRLDAVHRKYLSPRNWERFKHFPDNPRARELVREWRVGLRDIMDAHEATHCQIGRFYDIRRQMDPTAWDTLRRFKTMLDPDDLMNPGVLGL